MKECPWCNSTRVRKASAVVLAGTREGTSRTRGIGAGIGGSRRRPRVGLGIFASRAVNKSASLAARKADRARITWVGPADALLIFIILWVIFAVCGRDDPLGATLLATVAIAIACPLITWVMADFANANYDRRWYCDSCGELWTDRSQAN